MAAFEFPNSLQVLFGSIFVYAVYHVYWELTVGASRRALITKHGCKPIKSVPDYQYFPNNLIGYKILSENVAAMKEHRFLEYTRNRLMKAGVNTMYQRTIFTNLIQTVEPDNLKTVLSLNFKDWELGPRRRNAFLPFLGYGIFTTDGAAWQHSRELLRPNFVRSQVGDLATFERHIAQLIKNIPRDGSTVDLQELFFQLTMDSATEFLFGESTNCLAKGTASEYNMEFAECWNRAQDSIAKTSRSGKIGKLLTSQTQLKGDIRFVHGFVDRFVQRGLELCKDLDMEKADHERYIFLHELVKQTSDPVQIRSELLNILLAGRDTTASLLSTVWFVLARRPDIWQKLRAEVDALGDELPTYQQIKDMKYLRTVLNECRYASLCCVRSTKTRTLALRLYPVVPGNGRTAINDTVLPLGGGEDGKSPIFIAKGTTVQYSIYTMHRRKDHYGDDAEEFKPERWDTLRPGWVRSITKANTLIAAYVDRA